MKPKQLLPLVVILAVLAGLVAFKQMRNKPASIEEQYALKSLLPAGIDKSKIAKIEMYAGAKPDDKLVFERDGDAEKWKLTSRWDAPVAKDKIEKFLTTLAELQGEFRATVSEDGQKEYSVDDAGGFHVFGYAPGAAEPLFHLVNGKSPDFGLAFVRSAGSDDVYQINVSLRREAGIYTLDMGDAPEPGVWLDKTAFETPAEKIKAIALSYPDKELAFESREKPAEEMKPEAAADAKPADDKPAEDAAKPADEPKTFEWAVAKGGPGTEFNTNSGANLARRLSRINATDIVDPAKKADYSLDTPKYRATLTIEGEAAPVVIEAGRPAGDTYAYFRIAGRERDLVYKVSAFDFEQIFYKGGEFFELPGVLVDKGEVDSIEYTTDGRTTKLAREGDAWKLVEPKTDLPVQTAEIDNLVRALISWKAEDYADSPEGKGLDAPADRVVFRGPKVEHTIALGGVSPTEGRYARLDGREHVLVMSEADTAAIFAPYGKLFQTNLFEADSTAIRKMKITKGDQTAHIERNADDTGWQFALGDAAMEPADSGNVDELAGALAGMVADDFDFSEARAQGAVFGSVTFTTADGKETAITVNAEQPGGKHAVTKSSTAAAYLVGKSQIDSVFIDFANLKPVPAPVAEAPVAPATEGTPAVGAAESAPTPAADAPAAPESAPAPAATPQ